MNIIVKDHHRFNELILIKGHTKTSLAKKVGLSPSLISAMSRSLVNPSAPTAKKICDALGVGFEDIFVITKK